MYGIVVNIIVTLRPIWSITAVVNKHPKTPPNIKIDVIVDFSPDDKSRPCNAGDVHPYIKPADMVHKFAGSKKKRIKTK